MPTQLPRVNVTVTPEQHKLLLALASHTEQSASGFLRLMLDAATPFLREAVPMMREFAHDDDPDTYREFMDQFEAIFHELKEARFVDQLAFGDMDDRPVRAAANDARASRAAQSSRGRETGRPSQSPET